MSPTPGSETVWILLAAGVVAAHVEGLRAVWVVAGVAILAGGTVPLTREDEEEDGCDDDRLDAETLREQYARGEIEDLDVLEDKIELALDDDREVVRERVEEIPQIGPDISGAIAVRYGSLDALKTADREELLEVPGVGPQLADAISREVSSQEKERSV